MKHRHSLLAAFFCGIFLSLSSSASAEDWMARLHSSTPITSLSIPGSHDSGTGNGFAGEYAAMGEKYAKTQDCTLGEQWAVGVRAFDLRPGLEKDADGGCHLHIYHGILKTNLSYEDAIRQLIDSVHAHPSEFAIVVMRHENDADHNTDEWNPAMCDFLSSPAIKKNIVDYRPGLCVRDVRGKILVLSRNQYADSPVGGFITDWSSDEDLQSQTSAHIIGTTEQGLLYVQDYYETIGRKMRVKRSNIKRMLDLSTSFPSARDIGKGYGFAPLIINHTSGYSAIETINGNEVATTNGYRSNATNTNRLVINYLHHHYGPTGLVMMDFAGVAKSGKYKVSGKELVRKIIEQNFRKKPLQ